MNEQIFQKRGLWVYEGNNRYCPDCKLEIKRINDRRKKYFCNNFELDEKERCKCPVIYVTYKWLNKEKTRIGLKKIVRESKGKNEDSFSNS